MLTCANCSAENQPGAKFCTECGTALALTCRSCGAALVGDEKFCSQCGTPLVSEAVQASAGQPPGRTPPTAERRLVSVLFADLVGFTTLSESRDAEEVRELLSRYFETCRRLIELYGGTVEKFIGDAVMAVWGTPTTTEDDAERAVRAALDLVAAVSALGDEVGAPQLRARAGVLTGEAAVTLGASGQGMVAGDLVNTASRVQSVAEPGAVFVGESTRRATEPTIVFEDAGTFALKGKEGETRLWRALRVVSGVGGSLKSHGLEAPFIGRDRELRQIKDLFHVCADEKTAQLVSVTGIAGIGKSRLAWEFYKYFDGLAQNVYWHRGRCLAYGEGVTYWALADMVRMRCLIAEDDEPQAALLKLRSALDEQLLDAEERRFVEPRLAQLLGLGEHETRDRQDLFAAWRLFFERLADTYPTVLAFEDMQWADASLLDFVEYLLDWSRNHPIYVITLARPELAERRPTWGAGQRNFASLYLQPLSEGAMGELLAGLVPGLPASLREQILARAEGVPLYAVETVRMLLDRGLLVEDGPVYRVVGEVESLEIPETLQALVAARLDGLATDERQLLQDAAVLGKTFTPGAVAALTGADRAELDPLLAALVRKEVLGMQSDPRSPEHGQYGFLQDIVRHVAYETLPKRDRRAKHLAAAAHLSASLADDEVIEVVASHLLDAYRLDPNAPDAAELRERAYTAVVRAGERAASLGASAEAHRYFEQASELADRPEKQAAVVIRGGQTALSAGDSERARLLFEQAIELNERVGNPHAAARASSWLALIDQQAGRMDQAIERLERVYEVVGDDEPDADLALLLVRLGSAYFFAGKPERVAEPTERALDIAEALQLPEILVRGWVTKAFVSTARHPQEARGLFQLALETARSNELLSLTSSVLANLSDIGFQRDRYRESVGYLDQALELSRTIGSRHQEWYVLAELTYALTMLGQWPEAFARFAEIPDALIGANTQVTSTLTGVLEMHLNQGRLNDAQQLLARNLDIGRTDEVQVQTGYAAAEAAVRLAEGRPREALVAAERAFAARDRLGLGSQDVKQGFVHAVEAALALGDRGKAEELLTVVEQTPSGIRPPFLTFLTHRFRALLAGDAADAERHFATAAAGLHDLELPFHVAVVQLEHGEWLLEQRRPGDAEPLLSEARATFEELQATVWLERASRAAIAHVPV